MHTHQDVESKIHELEMSLEALRRVCKQLDRDVQDAIDGFYRRRQSDKMAAIRSKEELDADNEKTLRKSRPRLSVDDFVRAALAKSAPSRGSAEQPSESTLTAEEQ